MRVSDGNREQGAGEHPAQATLADCGRQTQDLLLYGNAMSVASLARLAESLSSALQISSANGPSDLSANSANVIGMFRDQVRAVGQQLDLDGNTNAAADALSEAAANFLFLPEVTRTQPEAGFGGFSGNGSSLGVAGVAVHIPSDDVPSIYREFLPEMGGLAAQLSRARDLFDVVLVTGRSGVGMALALNDLGIPCVEIPPLRMHRGSIEENRPAIPESLEAVREQITGKRTVFVDDQIGSATTLHYARMLTAEFGGTFVGAAMYRSKFSGEACRFLQRGEVELPSGMGGTAQNGMERAYPSLASLFQQRPSPF